MKEWENMDGKYSMKSRGVIFIPNKLVKYCKTDQCIYLCLHLLGLEILHLLVRGLSENRFFLGEAAEWIQLAHPMKPHWWKVLQDHHTVCHEQADCEGIPLNLWPKGVVYKFLASVKEISKLIIMKKRKKKMFKGIIRKKKKKKSLHISFTTSWNFTGKPFFMNSSLTIQW